MSKESEGYERAVMFANAKRASAVQYTRREGDQFINWWCARLAGKSIRHKIEFPETREQAIQEARDFRDQFRNWVEKYRPQIHEESSDG